MNASRVVVPFACLAVVAPAMCCGYALQAQEDPAREELLAEKWVEFMTPGSEHELLGQRVGTWKVTMEMWTAPGSSATVAEGTAKTEWIMGGRYLMDTIESKVQDQDFEGRGITGFDKLKKKFVSIWIDNFGTGFTTSTGDYDAATKTFEYVTMSPSVEVGDYKRSRTVERILSKDEWVLEMYDTTAEGQEFVTLKARYRRVER